MTDTISLRRQIKDVTGIVFRLTPFESILRVAVSAEMVTVLVESYKTDERKRETHLRTKVMKMYSITRNESGLGWAQSPPIVVEDSTFAPTAVNHFGPGKSVADWAEGKRRERLAYRAGASRTPMDTYGRVLDAPSTPKMERHWGR